MAQISAVLHGSMTPQQIRRDLWMCEGHNLMAQWRIMGGEIKANVVHAGIAKPPEKDRLRD